MTRDWNNKTNTNSFKSTEQELSPEMKRYKNEKLKEQFFRKSKQPIGQIVTNLKVYGS